MDVNTYIQNKTPPEVRSYDGAIVRIKTSIDEAIVDIETGLRDLDGSYDHRLVLCGEAILERSLVRRHKAVVLLKIVYDNKTVACKLCVYDRVQGARYSRETVENTNVYVSG